MVCRDAQEAWITSKYLDYHCSHYKSSHCAEGGEARTGHDFDVPASVSCDVFQGIILSILLEKISNSKFKFQASDVILLISD